MDEQRNLEGVELEDEQLEKIVGGVDPIELPEDNGYSRKSRPSSSSGLQDGSEG